jgi:large subunit ribosomal protein L25
VVDLVVEREGKEETFPCLIWNVDSHPVKPRHEHVDFLGIDPTQEVHLTVQIIATGKAKGVVEGGVMEWYRDSVNIVCLPKNIPDNIVVDVAPLKAGDRIHVEDLPLPEGVSIESEDNFAILGVTMKTAEELAEEEEAAEEESSEAVAEEEGSEA